MDKINTLQALLNKMDAQIVRMPHNAGKTQQQIRETMAFNARDLRIRGADSITRR